MSVELDKVTLVPNRLSESASPYLQLHAQQPVEWWPWCDEAWAYAREHDLPVFVSLGYSACHWCHVMSEESFDDPAIAKLLSAGFVAIKVDREEHPDVDAIYMSATQAMTGSGGWPTSIFCTPHGEPFFAGTYYPPEPTQGVPSFRQVLEALTNAWDNRRDEVRASAADITRQLTGLQVVSEASAVDLHAVRKQVADSFDILHAGFGKAPKFPPAMTIDALLVSGDAGELEMAKHTLEAMARGGIHDQLGGGFHRYAVDRGWVVPHFEKMLYDNALLLGSYTRGYRRTPDHDPFARGLFAAAAEGIVSWLEREMITPEGCFAASLDADSSDIRGMAHEGIYYCWNHDLLADALTSEEAAFAEKAFHVTAEGTFENGLSTLQLVGKPDPDMLGPVRDKLFAARSSRFRPARDDKVIAAWNGLMIDSLVQAALIFGDDRCLGLASAAAHGLWEMWDDNTLARSSRDGRRGPDGVCEDYAAVALGFARLAGALGAREWLDKAVVLVERANELFSADDGGWFDSAAAGHLYARARDVADSAVPSATSSMVAALHVVGLLAERDDLVQCAVAGAQTSRGIITKAPLAAGWALEQAMISDEARRGLKRATIVIVNPDADPLHPLNRAVWRMSPAGSAILTLRPGQEWGSLHVGRDQASGPTVYVCRGTVCFEPVTDVADLKEPLWSRC